MVSPPLTLSKYIIVKKDMNLEINNSFDVKQIKLFDFKLPEIITTVIRLSIVLPTLRPSGQRRRPGAAGGSNSPCAFVTSVGKVLSVNWKVKVEI